MTVALRVQLCGPLVIDRAGERLETRLPGRQGRLLLAYLALHRHRTVPRHELVAALRVARTRSFEISPLGPPPEIPVPRRPFALYPIWLLTLAATMVIVNS